LLDKTLNLFFVLLQSSSLQVATLVKDEEEFFFFEKIELLGIVPGNNSLIGIHFPFWFKFWGS
jgi:hypothetical protein